MSPGLFNNENIAIAYGMGITAEKVAEEWKVSREDQDAFAYASHQKAMAAIEAANSSDEILPFAAGRRIIPIWPATRCARKTGRDQQRRRPAQGHHAEALGKLRTVFRKGRQRHRRQLLADERRRRRGAAGLGAGDQGLRPDPAGALRQLFGRRRAPEVMGIGPIAAIPEG
jgi:acetyl-CoA acyltransferase